MGAVVIVVGAGAGVAWALTHRTTPKNAIGVDVTAAVSVTGPGSVSVSYTPADDPSLIDYIVVKRPSPGGPFTALSVPNATGSTFNLTAQGPGRACYEVEALLSHRPKTPSPSLDTSRECVTIP